MSGSIGGSRIKREEVSTTFVDYLCEVLMNYPAFRCASITGSYNAGHKKDHGDIDLVVCLNDNRDLKTVKKDFKTYLDSLDLPVFKTGNHKGEKTQLYGSIITCGYPIFQREQDYVQIDNVIVNNIDSYYFQEYFLNMDAAKQALVMGLVKTRFNKVSDNDLALIGVHSLPRRLNNQEFEFTLSQAGVSLRLVQLNDEHKEVDRIELWRSNDLSDLGIILKDFDLSKTYEELLEDVYNEIKEDERSCKRIVGVMKSIIHVGPGEVGTPKGEGKIKSIQLAESKLLF